MAKYGSDDVAFILIDGYSLAGYITDLSDGQEAVVIDSDTLGDSWRERAFTGLKEFGLDAGGFYNDADNASNEAFVDQYATRTICYGVEGNTTGQEVIMLYGPVQGKYERTASRGDLHRATVSLPGSGEVERGALVATLTARSGSIDTESTPVDYGSDTSDGGAVYLQCTALTLGGYDSVTINLRHSQDDVTYATKQAMTALTSAPGKERIALAGDIYRYTACTGSWAGSGSGESVTCMLGLHRN